MWAVGELELDHVLHVSGGSFGGLDTLEYGRMNPNREIPTICDDSLVLWESHAIVRYLAQSYGQGKLWPLNPAERAVSDQWMEWCKSHAFPAVFPLFLGTVRTEPEKRDMAAIAEKAEQAGKLLRILDDRLGEVPYIAKAEGSCPVFTDADGYAVNILAEDQRHAATIFASQEVDRFSCVEWSIGPAGNPVFSDAASWVDCSLYNRIDAGDHWILIGQTVEFDSKAKPLLGYGRGSYFTASLEHSASKDTGSRT
jgi:hypothetical protein